MTDGNESAAPASPGQHVPGLRLYRGWRRSDPLLAAVRACFAYDPPGADRATGVLYEHGAWHDGMAGSGPPLLASLTALTGLSFTVVVFQAYRDGSGCGWHSDTAFDAQAILSLGATRTFEVRPVPPDPGRERSVSVAHGDLIYMTPGYQAGWQHRVPEENAPGERCSLVFRTVEAPA